MQNKDLGINDQNGLIPFLPSSAWEIAEADFGDKESPTFSWLQVFWDAETFTDAPVLAVWSGKYNDANEPIVSPVYFAYPGERVFFKGKIIYAEGVDRFGATITSSDYADLERIIAYGGNS